MNGWSIRKSNEVLQAIINFSNQKKIFFTLVAKNTMFYTWIEIKSYGVRFNTPFMSRRAMKIAHQADESFR